MSGHYKHEALQTFAISKLLSGSNVYPFSRSHVVIVRSTFNSEDQHLYHVLILALTC